MGIHHSGLHQIFYINIYFLMLLIALPAFFLTGMPIIRAAFIALRSLNLNMDVMYSMGISVAFVSSLLATFGMLPAHEFIFYDTVVMLAAFLSLGRYLEERAKGKTSQALKKLIGLVPKNALVERGDGSFLIPVEDIRAGDIVVVKPGERIPADGRITGGFTYVDESMITGEPMAVKKTEGDHAVGGTININNTIRFRAEKVGGDTLLSHIIRLVEEAQNSRPRIQHIADRVVSYFIPVILFIAVSSFIAWYFIVPESVSGGDNTMLAINALIAVLVVACPCALGLATPTAVTVGVGKGAELGILIKNGNALETAGRIDSVVFDKTGTITVGKPEVGTVEGYGIDERTLLFFLASVEKESQHPLADAIVKKARDENISLVTPESFESAEGRGVQGTVEGKIVHIGKIEYIESMSGPIAREALFRISELEKEANTVISAAIDREFAGIVAISDQLKDSTGPAVDILKKWGLDVHLLTGDNVETAASICRQSGIEHFRANLLPAEKSSYIKEMQSRGRRVAFVGDGINDAPSLALSDLGMAVGKGTDIAIETGDIVLSRDTLLNVPAAIELSRRVMRRIKQNIFWAFCYNMLLVPMACGLLFPFTGTIFRPEYAGFAMAMSSFTVVSLSLLLKRYQPSFAAYREN